MEECSEDAVESQKSIKEIYSPTTNRIIVFISIATGSVWSGMAEECAGAVFTHLQEPMSPDKINYFRAWALPLGIVGSYFLMRTWGRKKSLLISNFISFFACIFLLFIRKKEIALIGCALVWFSRSAYTATAHVYASEITSPELRGFLGVLICLSAVFGSILNLTFRVVAKGQYGVRVCFMMSITSLILTSYNKESPYWLHHQRKPDKAKEVFLWIRGDDSSNDKELSTLVAREVNTKARIATEQFVNAFLIVISLMLGKMACGLLLIREVEMKILQTYFSANGDVCSIFLDSLRLFSSAILCMLILKFRRRTLFFISATSTLISLLSWSCVESFKPSLKMNLLPLVIFHNIFAFMGIIQIPLILATEIFSNQSRDTGFCCSSLLIVLLGKFISHEESILNYWLHLILMLLSSIAAYFIMPETLGITLQDAENKISTKLLKHFRI